MKRRATARCAAANDEEEDDGTFFDEPHPVAGVVGAKRRKEEADDEGEPPMSHNQAMPCRGDRAAPEVAKAKKEKEFAWMDSDDDEQEPEKEGTEAEEADNACEGGDDEENAKITAESLEEVQSFGRMILLAPALRKWLRSGEAAAVCVAAACRAMARTKFFDGEILEDLYEVLRKMLLAGQLDVLQTNDAIQCFWTLNAYERSVFSAIAASFRGKTVSMDAGLRGEWLRIFIAFGHEHEKHFLQVLDVPQVLSTSPTFRKIRCWYFAKGSCAVGAACTFLHDMHAPLSLDDVCDTMLHVKATVMTEQSRAEQSRAEQSDSWRWHSSRCA